ncbi:putative Arylsulfatase [Seiridium cardinale]
MIGQVWQHYSITWHDDFDGEPIPVTADLQNQATEEWEHVNVEYWGDGIMEGIIPNWVISYLPTNTFKHVRVASEAFDLSYTTDPHQSINIYDKARNISGYRGEKLMARLDALLLTLKGCKGRIRARPWETLHPQGNVANLAQALDSEYDQFYLEQQVKVSFSECIGGQVLQYEGLQSL